MKKLLYIIGGLFFVSSVYAAKKVKDLIDISSQLNYGLDGIPKINIGNKTIKINLKITNPTKYKLAANNININNITLSLANNEPFAITTSEISNIVIDPKQTIIIEDIKFIINLTLPEILQLLQNLNLIKLNVDVSAFGQNVTTIQTGLNRPT